MFNSIGLIAKRGDIRVKDTLERLVSYLNSRALEVVIDAPSARLLSGGNFSVAANTEALGIRCDLIIVIGGDGTLLQAARLLAKHDVSILGINLGRLGFLTDISPEQMEHYLDEILGGAFLEEDRFLIYAEVYREGRCLSHSNALNDMVIHRWNMTHMLTFETTINGHFMSRQRSDGLVVSTPTGSTAYALSGGGPIVHPSLNALLLVSICPHTLSNRPLVIDGDSCIAITIAENQTGQAQLSCDGVLCQQVIPGDLIVIEKRQSIRLIHPQGHDHYATLREKLDWGKAV
ncbi:putative sugar kinase [Beggiatoa alba B18LD]|uniref:NAD kinase n=1 Tax=Beggiatoa alba B18LD TaxID=395493 RepID=I3CFY1_9GAMM|nr:NAD(+) kinase [Beggiatoa alba]EIJ42524.1 putative sugar kinase [Beggiatoa alba B18LD]